MYRTDEIREIIREIKKYLYVVATRVYPQIDRTAIDGQYDEPTRAAVRKFQKIMGLREDGRVDLETFNALYGVYRDARDDFYARDYVVEDTRLPIGPGHSGEDVRALHILINELAKEHPDVNYTGTGGYFSTRTASAVQALRYIYGLEKSNLVDKKLFSIMLAELAAMRRRDKNPEQYDLIDGGRL